MSFDLSLKELLALMLIEGRCVPSAVAPSKINADRYLFVCVCVLIVLKEAYKSGGCVKPFGGGRWGFPARSVFLRLGR